MLRKFSQEGTRAINPVTVYLLNNLKRKYGDLLGDTNRTFLSNENPDGSAAHVSSGDADETGKVDVIRLNPDTERSILKGLTVSRIKEVEIICDRIKQELDSIDNHDDNFTEDLVTIWNAYMALGSISAHEKGHYDPTHSGNEFAGEDVAEQKEKSMSDQILRDMQQNAPDQISNVIQVAAKNRYLFKRRMLKIATELDDLGEFKSADEIDSFIADNFSGEI